MWGKGRNKILCCQGDCDAVGRKDSVPPRGAVTHRLHVQGSGRPGISLVFREGSSLRKEPYWMLSKGSPQIPQLSVFLEVCLESSQESLPTLLIFCWPARQLSRVFFYFSVIPFLFSLSLRESKTYMLPEVGFSTLRPRNQAKQVSSEEDQ